MSGAESIRADLAISNVRGLHARASAKFVQCAELFEADITVTRDNQSVAGTSIMGLLTLAAGPGSTISVEASGADAKDAITALRDLVESRFGEE